MTNEPSSDILVIDDEPQIRRFIAEHLRKTGRACTAVADPLEALEVARSRPFDAIVCDVVMPEMDGLDLIQRILAVRPESKIITMTGLGSAEVAKNAIRRGAFEYIEKPFELEKLDALIEEAIEAGAGPQAEVPLTDPLTGLPNHRRFKEDLAAMRSRCRRYQHPLSLMLIDVRDFDRINRDRGLAAGDATLRELGRRLRLIVRTADVLARFGDDEFVVIMPETSAEQARHLAERILTEARPDEPADVRLDIGIAECETGFIESESDLIGRAVEALELAKQDPQRSMAVWQPRRPAADTQAEREGVRLMVDKCRQLNSQLRQTYLESTRAMIAAVEAKDPYTKHHSMNVTHYAEAFAAAMGMDTSKIEIIRTAALLHDVGKIGIPDRILTKPGALTPDEFEMIKGHPAMALQILQFVSFLQPELPIILHHHERWDGLGYPAGLAGERIPVAARILQVADCIDAMLSRRAYKEPYSLERVIDELTIGAGTQFDPQIARLAADWLAANPDNLLQTPGPEPADTLEPVSAT